MAQNPVFHGVGVAIVTLFREDGDLDAPATAELALRLVETGVSAVVVAGTTGEAFTLEAAERSELVSTVRAALSGRDVALIAGTGAASGRQAARLTAQAREAGADAVLTLSPPGATGPRPYYEMVATAADGIPVLAYNFPRVSSPGIAVEALDDLPVDGIKDSSGDAGRLLATLDSWHKPVYSGSSALTFLGGQLGCAGVILAIANAEPETCIAAWEGDPKAQLQLAKFRDSEATAPKGIKELVAARFGCAVTCRAL